MCADRTSPYIKASVRTVTLNYFMLRPIRGLTEETGMTETVPSVLAADFAHLGREIADVRNAGAVKLHFDVMDGVFVPNISFGIPVLKSVRKATDMFLDVHLMIERPIRYVERFCEAGADLVTVHVEADTPENIAGAIVAIKACGKRAGLSVKPATPASEVLPYIEDLDLVLIMTVEPGFGGQSFMTDMLPKIREISDIINARGLDCAIEVDGGITPETARYAKSAGASLLVSGSAVFNSCDRKTAIKAICEA